MVASKKVKVPIYRGIGRQREWRFGVLAKGIRRTASSFLHKFIVPAAKRVGADLLEMAAPDIAEVVTGRKTFKTAAKSVARQTLRKQLGGGSRKTATKYAK